jgi:hypothetical protein
MTNDEIQTALREAGVEFEAWSADGAIQAGRLPPTARGRDGGFHLQAWNDKGEGVVQAGGSARHPNGVSRRFKTAKGLARFVKELVDALPA